MGDIADMYIEQAWDLEFAEYEDDESHFARRREVTITCPAWQQALQKARRGPLTPGTLTDIKQEN